MSDRDFIKWSVAIDWKQFTLSLTTGENIFLTFSYLSTSELIIIKQRRREKKYLSQLSLSDISLSAVFENNSETCFEMEGDTMYVISMYSCETVSLALACSYYQSRLYYANQWMLAGISGDDLRHHDRAFNLRCLCVPSSDKRMPTFDLHFSLPT